MQKQLAANRRALDGKPYKRFFLPEIEVPVAAAKSLRAGPMPIEQTLIPSISDLGRLVEHASDFPDAGYALLDGPTAYAQSRVVMPGVTTAMFEWWPEGLMRACSRRRASQRTIVSRGVV